MIFQPRKLPDGTLRYSRRGEPPGDGDIPEGYHRDPADSYVLRQNLPECRYRSEGKRTSDCDCQEVTYPVCFRGYEVSFKECTACIGSGRRDLNIGFPPEDHSSVIPNISPSHTISQDLMQSPVEKTGSP